MRGAQITELGTPPALGDIDEPQPHDGHVLVQVQAVALNPLDLAVGAGRFYGGSPPPPYAPGCEAVGRTEEGTLVYLFGDRRGIGKPGFLVERVVVPADLPLPVPDDIDLALAAAAGIAGIAGWVAVAWHAKPTSNDRVLVLGGTGTVGGLAAQAARLLGASCVVSVGSKDLDRIGEEFADDGFTICIDPVWGESLANALAYAAPHARIVHLGQSAAPESLLRSADVRGKELTIIGHSNFAMTKQARDRAYLELLDHLVAGRIELKFQTFPLKDVAAAWTNQRTGKSVVLVPR